MSNGYRQEVLNVLLAQLLQERGVVSAPETIIHASAEAPPRMPDVLIHYMGLRTVIEGEIEDQPDAAAKALASARSRVEQAIAHIGMAIVYPAALRHASFRELKSRLEQTEFPVAVVTESQEFGYAPCNLDALESVLRQTFEHLVKEDAVARAVALLHAGIEYFAGTITNKAGIVFRAAKALGISELPPEPRAQVKETVPGRPILPPRQSQSVSRVAGLVLINAMIFQHILSEDDARVLSLPTVLEQHKHLLIIPLIEHWKFIIREINYFPIFHLAREVGLALTPNYFVDLGVRRLAETAQEIVNMKAPLRHDLMGRVYHRLLADAKYLGTYYTSIPAAALLLKLALRDTGWPNVAWHDLKAVANFRIADLACGTGTLLMAAAESVTDNYFSAAAREGIQIDTEQLPVILAQNVLHGYDVLPSALHLTASTLALRAPHVVFSKMNLFSLPLGGPELRLGSIEYLNGNTVQMTLDLFGSVPTPEQLTGVSSEKIPMAPIPPLDLCVMNPPFTRSVGGNLLFGSAPENERKLMQAELKKLLKRRNVKANSTAGLGSVFVATADPFIKEGGRIGLVLPKAVLSGVAWGRTRQLFSENYQVEYLVASHDPDRWNFSESTALSEVLIVAVKAPRNPPNSTHSVTALNLWRNPDSVFNALSLARGLIAAAPPSVAEGQGAWDFHAGQSKLAESVTVPWNFLRSRHSWMPANAFAQSDLIRVAFHLLEGKVWLPGRKGSAKIAMCRLADLGSLGPDVRDLYDGFKISKSPTIYRAFLGRDAKTITRISDEANGYLTPLSKPKAGRKHLRKVEDLWPLAGRLLIAERLRLNTQSIMALRVPKPVLSNVWWPFTFKKKLASAGREKALLIWLNSTLGVLMMLMDREETEGAWVKFKKPILANLMVPDFRTLAREGIARLSSAFDELSSEPLLPFAAMDQDRTRARIDSAISRALSLPDLDVVREMLAREPVISLRHIG